MGTEQPRECYKQTEAAKRLGIDVRTLRRWQRDGKIRASRPHGGAVLIPVSEVQRIASGVVIG